MAGDQEESLVGKAIVLSQMRSFLNILAPAFQEVTHSNPCFWKKARNLAGPTLGSLVCRQPSAGLAIPLHPLESLNSLVSCGYGVVCGNKAFPSKLQAKSLIENHHDVDVAHLGPISSISASSYHFQWAKTSSHPQSMYVDTRNSIKYCLTHP